MSRIKAVGVYQRDDFRPLKVFPTKKKSIEFMDSLQDSTYAEFFYYLTPDQLAVLSYAQARDLETILKFATEETREKNL